MRTTCRVAATCLLAAALLGAAPDGRAEGRVVAADFTAGVKSGALPEGWKLSEKSGKADVALVKEGGVAAVRLRSADTSFSIQRELAVDLQKFPTLTWRWKVTKLPTDGDFRKSATDDQAAQLFVLFSRSRAIVYVWSSTVPVGTTQSTSPAPGMTVQVVVMRSGPASLGKWVRERRNVREDYGKLFGAEALEVSAMRLQINSQHTGTSAESFFADVAFEGGKAR